MICSKETMTKRGAWKRLRPTGPPEKDTFKTVKLTDDCTVQVPRFYELPPMLEWTLVIQQLSFMLLLATPDPHSYK